jgi:tetratricopeptide (TPR) repeat protein
MFVIEVDFLVESITKKKTQFVPWIIIISASLLLCGVYFFSLANLVSAVSVLKGEYLVKQAQDKLSQSSLTQDQQKTELNKAIAFYTDGINSARWNYILYRRVSLLYVEYVQILGSQYSTAASQIEKESLLKDITRYAGNATDNAVRSTDISSVVLRNWTNRISVYYDIISLGLSNYLPQGIDSVKGAMQVSPYNNVLYYYESQFLLLEAKPNDALNALTKSLYYNPKHIPSLIVAGDIEYGNKSWANSRNYYQQALDLLKESDGANSDMYKSIQNRIEEINKKVAE